MNAEQVDEALQAESSLEPCDLDWSKFLALAVSKVTSRLAEMDTLDVAAFAGLRFIPSVHEDVLTYIGAVTLKTRIQYPPNWTVACL